MVVDVVVTLPVYNEEATLEKSVNALRHFLSTCDFSSSLLIVDNASTDGTKTLGEKLSRKKGVEYARLERKGRGLALRTVWAKAKGKVVAYMDIDLSTGLESFPELVQSCLGEFDVATGSRHLKASLVDRSLKRAILSRTYNEFVRLFLRSRVHDHQCGFKAVKKDSLDKLLPLLLNENWFFDTELLILAQRKGMSIKEIPVRWSEDRMRKSTVRIVPTIREYVLNVVRLMKR